MTTLEELLVDNHVDLITEKDKLPQRNPEPKTGEEKECSVSQLASGMGMGIEEIVLFSFSFEDFGRLCFLVQQM